MGFVYAFVVGFVYLLGFVSKFSYFEMVEIVAVFVCDILYYMVQKYLVDSNHHHQMISNLCYKEFVVYSYFVEKMDNFHYNPVEGVDYLGNLLNWSMFLGDSNNGKIRDLNFVYCFGEVGLFLVCEHNFNCVLKKVFLVNGFLVFDGIVIGLYV